MKSDPIRESGVGYVVVLRGSKGTPFMVPYVGEATGLSAATLAEVEYGRDPMLTTARKLATFFGCPVEELWPEEAAP